MAAKNFQAPDSEQEALNYHNASTRIEKFTVGASAQAVTVPNPHVVCNSQATAATIAVRLAGQTTYVAEYFVAGQEKVMQVTHIGGTGEGSTNSTVVTVRGIE